MEYGYAEQGRASGAFDRGYVGSAQSMPTPMKPDCLGNYMADLDAAINGLGDEIGMLVKRMEPITRQIPQANTGQSDSPAPIRSRVSDQVVQATARIRNFSQAVRLMHDSLDL